MSTLGGRPGLVLTIVLSVLFVPAMAAATDSAVAANSADCTHPVRVLSPDGEPLEDARVSLVGTEQTQVTDEHGAVCFRLSEAGAMAERDSYSLVVSAEGWTIGSATLRRTAPRPTEVTLLPAFGEEMVISGTGNLRRLQDTPVHIQQLDRSAIVATAARSLADAIEFAPGLRIENNCQNCNTTQVRLLGLEGPYTQIVVDGQPTVSSLALVYGLEQIPARMLDGIEVLKGSGSAIYGASSVAGTINLLPHQADHTHIDVDLESTSIEGNSDESGSSLRGLVDWGHPEGVHSITLHGQLDSVPAVDVDGDGFSEVTDRELATFGARAQKLFGDGRLQLVGDLNWTDAERRGGDLSNPDKPPHFTSLSEAIATDTFATSARLLHNLSARTGYRASVSRVEIDRDSYYGADFDPDAYGESQGTTTVFSSQVDHTYDRSTFSWGLQAQEEDLFDAQPGYGRFLEETHRSYGLFAQEDRKLRKGVSLLYGARIDDHSSLADPIVSPRAALLVSPRANLTLRAAVGTGFRPPSTFDEDLHIELVGGGQARIIRDDPNLVEERSRSALLSMEWRPTFGRRGSGAFEVAVFDTRLEDLFFHREADVASTPEIELLRVNLGGAEVRGAEVSGSVRVGSNLQADFGFVVQTARFDEPEPDFGSRDFYRTPEQHGNLGLRWSPGRSDDLFVGILYTGEMVAPHYAGFIAEDRLERTPTFVTVDANWSHTFRLGDERNLQTTLGVRNVTNEYQDDLDRGPLRDSAYVVGPRFPRTWFASFGLRF